MRYAILAVLLFSTFSNAAENITCSYSKVTPGERSVHGRVELPNPEGDLESTFHFGKVEDIDLTVGLRNLGAPDHYSLTFYNTVATDQGQSYYVQSATLMRAPVGNLVQSFPHQGSVSGTYFSVLCSTTASFQDDVLESVVGKMRD
ncbi:MAG: hypothetical protein AB7T49_11215 [Oligoflexales bacterium]